MKKIIKKLFLLAVSAFVLVGCSQFKGSAPIPHLDLGIKVVDAEGNNLVGSAMYGDSVKVLPLKQYVSKDTCFHNGVIFVNIAPEKHDDKPTWITTYIQWNSYDTDTVRAIFGRYGPYSIHTIKCIITIRLYFRHIKNGRAAITLSIREITSL